MLEMTVHRDHPGRSRRRTLLYKGTLLIAMSASVSLPSPAGSPYFTGGPAAQTGVPLPRTPLPKVEPMQLEPIAVETARTINAATPFARLANPPARPFQAQLAGIEMERAITCLAAAAYYEAGDDADGQRSVVQVVLNRMRHPAFPKTICGVIFQGSERQTGCQFTFTCDGALARRPSPAAWDRARTVARAALSGAVDERVGVATHYHTDWVLPYWSRSLLKLTAVKTHLFFRWPGGWGSLAALRGQHGGHEPVIPAIGWLSEAHRGSGGFPAGQPQLTMASFEGLDGASSAARRALPVPPMRVLFQTENDVLVLFDSRYAGEAVVEAARGLCGDRPLCRVRGWTEMAHASAQLPIPPSAVANLAFSYIQNPAQRFTRMQWDCRQFPRRNSAECLKVPFAAKIQERAQPDPTGMATGVKIGLTETNLPPIFSQQR